MTLIGVAPRNRASVPNGTEALYWFKGAATVAVRREGRRDAGLGYGGVRLPNIRIGNPAVLLAALGDPEAVLLEDGKQAFSVLALAPRARVLAYPRGAFRAGRIGEEQEIREAGLEGLRKAMRIAGADRVPAFGYIGYSFAARVEDLPLRTDDTRPDVALMVPGLLLRVDHRAGGEVTLLTPRDEVDEAALADVRRAAASRPGMVSRGPVGAEIVAPDLENHREAVERAREFIRQGETFQIVLARPFRIRGAGDALSAYDRLRAHHANYGGYVHVSDMHLSSASPELLVARRGRRIRTMPIAGTRPRGASAAEDRRLRAELLSDPKERAEHAMLLDLGRNDLGRVARYGSVEVTSAFRVYAHPTVLHITSHVVGILRPDLDSIDLVASVFPAGTVSGAPKVRAMELIGELENDPRGPYAGAFGYVQIDGPTRLAITLRTAVFQDGQGDLAAEVWAGGGIVTRSDPEAEGREIHAKAGTVLRTVWPDARWTSASAPETVAVASRQGR